MKTMKVIIMAAFLGFGFALTACDDDELIAPNEMTGGSATKITIDPDSTANPTNPIPAVGIGGNGNGGTTNGNGNGGNGGNGGVTGP